MWVNPDVNMPQTLITAQREGSLVVFAGAGVSMGNPSNLPGYDELADAIATGSVTRQPQEPSDRFLGRAEQQGVDVQGSCRHVCSLTAPSRRRCTAQSSSCSPRTPPCGWLLQISTAISRRCGHRFIQPLRPISLLPFCWVVLLTEWYICMDTSTDEHHW